MDTLLNKFSSELSKMYVGRVNTDMFDHIQVGSYGFVSSAGQVTLKSANKLTISVYDPAMTEAVCEAVRTSGLGLSPTVEGSQIAVSVPKPSKEARENLVKSVNRSGERCKLEVRGVRKDLMDEIKRCKASPGVSEDEAKKASKEVEALTEKKIEKIAALVKEKEKEISSIS